ncbi:MAG: hypothetical protein EBX52_05040 [Proteobacteria bacterium]|nr:hypothetical protein [Pseudomonadota bacterium]
MSASAGSKKWDPCSRFVVSSWAWPEAEPLQTSNTDTSKIETGRRFMGPLSLRQGRGFREAALAARLLKSGLDTRKENV